MSIPKNSRFACLSVGSLLLASSAWASVSVIDGQLVDSRNHVIDLRLATEPLAIDGPELFALASTTVTFNATPSKVSLSKAGSGEKMITVTSMGLNFTFVDHGVFNVSSSGSTITVSPNGANTTGCPISDQFHLNWTTQWAKAYKPVNVSQDSNAKPPEGGCGKRKLSLSEMSPVGSRSAAPPSAIAKNFEAAFRRRTADGSNAVRVVLSAEDVRGETAGPRLTLVLQACERYKVWCLLDTAKVNARAANAQGILHYFVSPEVRAALLKHQEQVILVVRKADTAISGTRAALYQLRAAGLPHLVVFEAAALRSSSGVHADPSALLGLDPYQAIALTLSSAIQPVMSASAVPVLSVPEGGIVPAAAPDNCKITVNEAGALVLQVQCSVLAPAAGLTSRSLEFSGSRPQAKANKPWFRGNVGATAVSVTVDPLPAGTQARYGILTIQTLGDLGSHAWAYVQIIQSP